MSTQWQSPQAPPGAHGGGASGFWSRFGAHPLDGSPRMLSGKENQTWHDKVANAVVVPRPTLTAEWSP